MAFVVCSVWMFGIAGGRVLGADQVATVVCGVSKVVPGPRPNFGNQSPNSSVVQIAARFARILRLNVAATRNRRLLSRVAKPWNIKPKPETGDWNLF